jgi:amino acid adenylation domain-containing protein/thioester reductase-like protein
MRTAFNVDDDTGELVQDIRPTPNHEWVCTAIEDDSALENAIATVEHQVYDLQGGRTSSFMLCTLSEQVHYLVVGYHHIILDGTAWQIVLRDVLSMYSSGEVLPLARMQYRHYALDGEEDSEDHRAFWKAQFATVPSTLPLFPFAKTAYRFPIQTPSIHTFEEAAPVHITEQVKMACRKLGITTMHFHVSVLQIMVSLLAGTRELCIGMGDANRNDERYGDVAGLLASVHPLRLVLEDGVSFAQVAGQARDAVLAAMDHAQVSFETIIDDIGVERNSSFTPLFQVMINYVSGFSDRINLEGATIKHHYAAEATHAQDLILTIRDTREEMRLYFTVQESLYTRGHAQMMAKIYIDLLDHCSINVDEQVNTLDLLRPEWREQGLRLGQGLTIPLPNLESLDRLIADKAGQYPNNVAAKDDTGRTISYSGLMDRVGDIAATLATCGTSSGVPVCIIGDHTIDVLCAVIAVWKLGAVYVPIDADNPHERIKTMLKNCKATVAFVSGEKAMSTARETKISVIITADLRVHSLTDEFPVAIMPPDTAAIFHTSGTTGEPKGVILTHDNLLTQVAAVQQRYPSLQPRVLQQSGHSFDASLFQILVSLCTGGTLVMTAHRREPETITKIICDESITTTLAVPSEYLMWFQYGKELSKASHWHTAFCGGDAMTNNVIRGFAALELRNLQLINAYGPTEASITCSMGTVNYCTKDSELLSTGSALPNYTLSVVDEQGRPLPPGWTGEVCIQGRALSPGYVDASLQVYSFESHKSFVKELHESYLTGDVGRMTGDGNLLLMGRIVSDSYQKIHGNRIEPLEISKVILQASDGAIAECAAIIKSDETPFIVAYVTFARDHNIEAQEEYLRRLKGSLPLPSYMLPATILPVAELPKTSSGKVDNKALRSLSLSRQRLTEMSQDCITADEEIVAAIWNEVIPTPLHSLYKSSSADFFSVGGNSILLLKVISKLRNLSNPDLTLRTVLENPTLSGMAALIRSPGFLEQDRNVRIDELDWGWETSLSNSIPINIVRSPSSTKSNTGHVVLLTGATGFIGRHILSILCSHDQVAAVHCVAVRSPDSLQDIVTTYPNVHLHAGDLASPLLGLSQKDFSSLAASITMIVHNGATVSFLQPYASLRAANVTSTKELIRLATPRRIPFHYISTAGVAELTDLSSLREKSVARYIPPAGASGYTTSKWASEVVLENASASYEIPVTVHRPSSVVEAAEKPDEVLPHDALGTLLRFSRKLRAVPLLKKWTGCFDMVPVDQVAQHIVEEALLPSTGGIRYKHIAGSKTVSAQGLDKFVATQMQDLVEVVPMEDWIDRAKTHGLREDLSEWFLAVASKPRFLPPIVMGSDL